MAPKPPLDSRFGSHGLIDTDNKRQFACWPDVFWTCRRSLQLGPRDTELLLYIHSRAGLDDSCRVATSTLARTLGMDIKTTRRRLKWLAKGGFIEIVRKRTAENHNLPNHLRLWPLWVKLAVALCKKEGKPVPAYLEDKRKEVAQLAAREMQFRALFEKPTGQALPEQEMTDEVEAVAEKPTPPAPTKPSIPQPAPVVAAPPSRPPVDPPKDGTNAEFVQWARTNPTHPKASMVLSRIQWAMDNPTHPDAKRILATLELC